MARANHLRRRRSQKRNRPTAAIRTMDKFHSQRIASPSDRLDINLSDSSKAQIILRSVLRADCEEQIKRDYREYHAAIFNRNRK